MRNPANEEGSTKETVSEMRWLQRRPEKVKKAVSGKRGPVLTHGPGRWTSDKFLQNTYANVHMTQCAYMLRGY